MEDSEGFTQVAMGTDGAHAAFQNVEPQKHGLFAQFYMHPKQNAKETLLQGRPIYDETEYIRIMVPGDKASIVERPVRLGIHPNSDNNKFSVEYSMFKQNKSQEVTGTPLSEWPVMSRSQVLELEHFNVRTVEQLAGMADSHAQKFMGLNSLRELARRFMQHAEGSAPLGKMQAALDESANVMEAQKEQMKAMSVELASLRAQVGGAPALAAIPATIEPSHTTAVEPARPAAPTEDPENADDKYAFAPLNLGTESETVAEESEPAPKTKKRAKRSIAK